MNRRRFLTTSLTAAGAGALAPATNAQTPTKAAPEYYELRQYHLRVTMRQRFSDHFKDEALPAYNRAGIGPIGVFTVAFGPDSPTFWVLLPHKNIQSVAEVLPNSGRPQYKSPSATDVDRPGYVRMTRK